MRRPAIAFVGDDFTGASDTLATLTRAGLATRLYTRLPATTPDDLDAIGIATELRAMGPAEGRVLMEQIAPRLASVDARMVHFKVCSTFDSSPQTGNIAAAADVLAEAVDADLVAILGGQPSLKRYCLFGTLFAGAADDQVHRIDRHPVMAHHPITPMAEADLRRHLALQGWRDIGLVDYRSYAAGAEALRAAIQRRMRSGERRLLFDVATQHDLAVIGQALRDIAGERRVLCVGASSVAQAVAVACRLNNTRPAQPSLEGRVAPVLVISGSRSPATATQIETATGYDKTMAPASAFLSEALSHALATRCAGALQSGQNVLVAVSPDPDRTVTGRALSSALAAFATSLVSRARPDCLVVAGGDTSSAIVSALDVEALEFVRDIDPGVSLVRAVGGASNGLSLILKGGQMGSSDFFDKLLRPGAAPRPLATES